MPTTICFFSSECIILSACASEMLSEFATSAVSVAKLS